MKLSTISDDRRDSVTVSEASLTRLLAKVGEPFGVITAYRKESSRAQNIVRNREMRTVLNGHRLGVHQLVGHWRECQDQDVPYAECPPSRLVDVVERSYFVQKPPDMSMLDFDMILYEQARKYKQDAYLLYDGRDVLAVDKNGNKTKIGTGPTLGRISEFYSRHIRKLQVPFVFEGLEVPSGNMGRLLWRASGLVVPPSGDPQIDLVAESVN